MERVDDRQDKMERYCSTGQSPQRAVEPMEEVFYIQPDDGSVEPKHVAEFLILLPIYVVLLTE